MFLKYSDLIVIALIARGIRRGVTVPHVHHFSKVTRRTREIAAQICPPLEEKEMTKIYLKTLSSFYYGRMVASAPSDFTEMVNMGVRLEEAVREGRLTKETETSSSSKKYGSAFPKKKDQDVSAVLQNKQRRRYQQQVATVSPIINSTPAPTYQPQVSQQHS